MEELIALRTLSGDASPEEAAVVESLASASRDRHSRLAVELARTPYRRLDRAGSPDAEMKRARRLYLWAGAGLAASLILAVALIGWWRLAHTPERLLAEAYTHSRIFELRMPGAGFAGVTPRTHLRGSGTGRESALLLDARSEIERHLEDAPEDAHWLQLEARADLLEEKFDPAIEILDRLLAAGPVTRAAGGRWGRLFPARRRGRQRKRSRHRARLPAPRRRTGSRRPLVLFNEAVVMEDRGQLMNAVETWNRYLQFERDPVGWQKAAAA